MQKEEFILATGSRGSRVFYDGEAWQQAVGLAAEAGSWELTFSSANMKAESEQEEENIINIQSPPVPKSDIRLPETSSLLSIPNNVINWGPNIQIPEPISSAVTSQENNQCYMFLDECFG